MADSETSVASDLTQILRGEIARAGGWLPFDRFMAWALYAPGLGYYANPSRKFGAMPSSGSDFVTAPEMTPLFARTLALQIREALEKTGTHEVWEFGAGSGALAEQLLFELGDRISRYSIVEVSAVLQGRQRERVCAFGKKVQWALELPEKINGVIVGNEVLDAMPVKLIARIAGRWHERGVECSGDAFTWKDRPSDLRPPVDIEGTHDYVTELHPQAEAFIRTMAERLDRGAAFFIDYGFPESEYYHPQRHMGTVMTHRGHMADPDPLSSVGEKDITAHVNFSAIAHAAQRGGMGILGYTSQGRFLLNCGIERWLIDADLPHRAAGHRLLAEHEMGELFKVLALHRGYPTDWWDATGFRMGDRTDRL